MEFIEILLFIEQQSPKAPAQIKILDKQKIIKILGLPMLGPMFGQTKLTYK